MLLIRQSHKGNETVRRTQSICIQGRFLPNVIFSIPIHRLIGKMILNNSEFQGQISEIFIFNIDLLIYLYLKFRK